MGRSLIAACLLFAAGSPLAAEEARPAAAEAAKPPNILFVLCDDHRFDCLGVAGHPFLETPHLDALAERGTRFTRAYVTTSLCSPSRASILTGQFAHTHRVVDNYHPVDPGLVFFPQHLQAAGYETAFIGKWHMGGEIDDPQRGFDHWVAFKGQGTYFPDGAGTTREVPQTTYDGFNVNGERVPQKGYITDELTDYALDWIGGRSGEKPWFAYVSHKAVHSDFVPAEHHRGRYDGEPLPIAIPTPEQLAGGRLPMWVRNQRNSRHGADFGYNLPDFDPTVYYRRYCEALLAVDESIGRLTAALEASGEPGDTLIVYMGDNGFQFGDHGLIDKRTAYEASAKVPLIVSGGGVKAGTVSNALVANIDIAPTLLEAAGAEPLPAAQGRSFWSIATTDETPDDWRGDLLYEYYWERNYPHTPTIHALIGGRYKYVRVHGIWDRDELYDLASDPGELKNLAGLPEHAAVEKRMNDRLWQRLAETNGREMPLLEDRGRTFPWRHPGESKQAPFPKEYEVEREPAAGRER